MLITAVMVCLSMRLFVRTRDICIVISLLLVSGVLQPKGFVKAGVDRQRHGFFLGSAYFALYDGAEMPASLWSLFWQGRLGKQDSLTSCGITTRAQFLFLMFFFPLYIYQPYTFEFILCL